MLYPSLGFLSKGSWRTVVKIFVLDDFILWYLPHENFMMYFKSWHSTHTVYHKNRCKREYFNLISCHQEYLPCLLIRLIVRNCTTEIAWAWSWSQSFKMECTPSGIMQLWNFTIFHCYWSSGVFYIWCLILSKPFTFISQISVQWVH